jgi:Domain of unknown function (DUF6378)
MSIQDEAQSIVNNDRYDAYGHPLDNFTRIGKMWSAILGIEVDYQQVGLMLQALKISRHVNTPKRDNRVDGIGYWIALDMAIEEAERRARETN